MLWPANQRSVALVIVINSGIVAGKGYNRNSRASQANEQIKRPTSNRQDVGLGILSDDEQPFSLFVAA